ncbi:MAG: hypothetical protein GX929_08240 [Clostridiales bacterium]|jgi:cell division protein FtsL|nr:hypothetical protein [Clostridiales bacterium]
MKKITFKLLLRVLLIVFSIYAAYNLVTLRVKLTEKRTELNTIQKNVEEQTLTNQQLEESMSEELTDEEIAKIAREKLGYALPGEQVFIDITGK